MKSGSRLILLLQIIFSRLEMLKRYVNKEPVILLAVSFLATRVKEADQVDQHKIIRFLGYLKNMESLHLTLSCTS